MKHLLVDIEMAALSPVALVVAFVAVIVVLDWAFPSPPKPPYAGHHR